MIQLSRRMEVELEKFEYTVEKIVTQVEERFDLSGAAVFLAGSIVDELSTEESDIDILIIGLKETAGPRSMIDEGMVVDTIGLDGGRLQIAQCSFERLKQLVSNFGSLLDPKNGQLKNLSTPEKRILHRVCNGVSIYNHDITEYWRAFVGKETFSKYCLVIHTYSVQAALKDALGEIKGKHWMSACTQLQRASTFLGMSRLNELGETNQNPKWVTRLVQNYSDQIKSETVSTIQRGMLPSLDLTDNPSQIVAMYDEIFREYEDTLSLYPELFTDKGSET